MNTRRSKPSAHLCILLVLLAALLGGAIGATPAYASTVIVTKTADTNDGMCDSDCSLREAIATAGVGDTITFDASLSGTTIHLGSILTLAQNVTIDGSALATQITISGDTDNDGTGDVRVFTVNAGATVILDSLTITKGSSVTGAGILNAASATLTITNSTLSDNASAGGPGGGIRNDGTLTVTNSTFSSNSAAAGSGGAIRNAGALTVANSTFSGNTTTGSGGGIYNFSGFISVTITNSSFSGNAASSQGGGIYYSGGVLNYANTIIANSTSGGDCVGDGTIGTNINNLVEDASCSASLNGDPSLGALANNGGPTQTFALGLGSPAIDAGDNTTCAAASVNNLDQRGVARPQGTQCDIGAYERHQSIVTKLADSNDGICDSDCSLREAIATVGADDIITFAASLSGGTIHLASSLTIAQNMAIDGSALAAKITISGDSDNNGTGDVRVLFVHSGMTVSLDSLIITKGNGTASSGEGFTGGGGIQNNSGNNSGASLTVTNSIISDNSADKGAGILNTNGSTLTVTNSTISGNSAAGDGGGILSDGNLLAITNSTISGNTAAGDGGGVRNGNIMTLTNSTISGNAATGSGGGIRNAGSLTAKNNTLSSNSASIIGGGIYSDNTFNATNNIIANSTSGGDCAGEIDTNINNLVEDGSCSDNGTNFLTGDPSLGALANNGGSTQTIALGLGSPAIDAGDDTTCTNSPVSGLDQRGVARPVGAHCDIGAFEGAQDISAPTVDSFAAPSLSSSLSIPITAFSASDNVAVTGYIITATSAPPSAGAAGWAASAPTTYAVASDGSYTLYPWAKDAAGNVSAVFGSPASVTVDTSAPTVTAFTAPSPSTSLSIPISTFTASDVVGVTGYKITETSTPPAAGAAGWTAAAPTSYTVGSDGTYTLYPWAKDAAGNVSAVFGSPASVTVDTSAPTVTAFTATSPSTSLSIPVTAFSASDNIAVTGYIITETSTPPSASAAGWSGTAPTIYTVVGDGSYTLYPWAKDAAGHVSAVFGSPASITVSTSAPIVVSSVRANANPSTAASVDFSVTFSEAVTGVDATDFSLTTTGSISGAVISAVSGSGTTYTVTVSTGSGSGTIRLDVADNDTIVDATANPLGGLGANNGAFTSGEAYTIRLYRISLPLVIGK